MCVVRESTPQILMDQTVFQLLSGSHPLALKTQTWPPFCNVHFVTTELTAVVIVSTRSRVVCVCVCVYLHLHAIWQKERKGCKCLLNCRCFVILFLWIPMLTQSTKKAVTYIHFYKSTVHHLSYELWISCPTQQLFFERVWCRDLHVEQGANSLMMTSMGKLSLRCYLKALMTRIQSPLWILPLKW